VGSHQPQTPGGTVFKEGVPLLWTTSHGLQHDELLIVSSPKELISNAIESGGKLDAVHDKTPSVSLAGADVVIEYVIRNFENYSSIYSKPEEMLNIISKSEVSRFVLSFDIDMLLSQGRAQMAQVLKDRIQKNCDNLSLGIKILNVAITAVHPPTDIADAFEENVSALQERETKIQQARQSASRAQIETAGSVESFASLSQQINNEEDSSGKNHIETEKMIWNCGGQISRILSDATGYRWSRENTECGKTEKFIEELKLYKIAKKVYFYERYLSVLEEALATKKKFLLSDSLRNTLIDVGTNVGRNTGSVINDFKNTF
jgi:regulator of protease activity HflC (stomatin/prohibitin superfamily)